MLNDQRSSPNLTKAEIDAQFAEFVTKNTSSSAARSSRYELGIKQATAGNQTQSHAPGLDLSVSATPGQWQCTSCQECFDESKLKIHESRGLSNTRLAMCPSCGGAALDLYSKTQQHAKQQQASQAEQRRHRIELTLFGAMLLLFAYAPNNFTYLGAWTCAITFGPLKTLHTKMKLGAILAVMAGGFVLSTLISRAAYTYLETVGCWLLMTVLLFLAGSLIEKVSSLIAGVYFPRN